VVVGANTSGDTPPEVDALDTIPSMRIGQAAAEAGMSTRTLRYYQELGLLTPAGTTAGGARRYSEADVARLHRIRHLRDLIGLDLNEVGRVLRAEDRLAAIRREWWDAQTPRGRAHLLGEAMDINTEMQDIVRSKMASLQDFLAGLEERAESIRAKAREFQAEVYVGP
jgi:DNA-binding transcriptional MerR regulator